MLTRKQKWRKTVKRQGPIELPQIFTFFCPRQKFNSDSNLIFEDNHDKENSEIYKIEGKVKNKKIRFQKIVKVFPILRKTNSFGNSLWWTDEDYDLFRQNYIEDLKKSEKYNSM